MVSMTHTMTFCCTKHKNSRIIEINLDKKNNKKPDSDKISGYCVLSNG